MKNPKSLIIKIALGVSAVAFIFSLVTLIRNIVIGSMVFVSVMQLIGAAVIVIICFAMFRIFSGMEEEDEGGDEAPIEKDDSPQEEDILQEDNFASDKIDASDIDADTPEEKPEDSKTFSDGYDLDLFEE